MIILAFAVFGGLLGALIARNRGGGRLDIAQYAAALAIAGAIIGIFVTLFFLRSMG